MKGYTLEDKSPDHLTELQKHLFLKLIVKSFQRLCHGQLDLDILFVKLRCTNSGIALEKYPLHIASQGLRISCNACFYL